MGTSRRTVIEAANAELIDNSNLDAIADFFTEDYAVHLTERRISGGHSTIRRIMTLYRSAFENLQAEVEVLVEGDDRIAWQRTLRAIHTGSFKGFPATGRPIVWREMVASRFRDGLIVEEWLSSDLAEQLLSARKGSR